MAKILILSSDVFPMKDEQTGEEVKMTGLQVLKKVGKDFVVKKYFLPATNQKGFKPDMVSDPFEDKVVSPVEAQFTEKVDYKTKHEYLALVSLAVAK
jgi:hypothetical protein